VSSRGRKNAALWTDTSLVSVAKRLHFVEARQFLNKIRANWARQPTLATYFDPIFLAISRSIHWTARWSQ
jgi:hypothetical protein